MPAATTTVPAAQPTDDLDDLFNYDVDDDVFAKFQTNTSGSTTAMKTSSAAPKVAGLGIEKEIQVVKKRQPIAKLDENRLLSQPGIPKLRRITKERLKFKGKGKGHEYTDVARLLNLYQLWLDDLYPRAKFADGLAMIEKLGHTKRMQTMRREWIREGKPVERIEERRGSVPKTVHPSSDPMDLSVEQEGDRPGNDGGTRTAERPTTTTNTNWNASTRKAAGEESLFFSDDENPPVSKNKAPDHPEDENFDDLDALLAESFERTTSSTSNLTKSATSHDDPPEDDLDALLAEDAANATSGSTNPAKPAPAPARDDFEDEMEAMADMDMW